MYREVNMNKYIELLKTWDGEFEDLCFELYKILEKENESEQILHFQMICETVGTINSDKSKKIEPYFESEEIEKLKMLYGKYIDEVIDAVRKKVVYDKLTIQEFYKLLWNMVMKNSMLNSEKEKAFGLLWILADNGIPYFELGAPLSMENDEYGEIVENHKESIDRIKYIFSIPFEQKTEVASLVLQELFKYDDYKVQTVLLTQAMGVYAKKETGSLKRFLSAMGDMEEE